MAGLAAAAASALTVTGAPRCHVPDVDVSVQPIVLYPPANVPPTPPLSSAPAGGAAGPASNANASSSQPEPAKQSGTTAPRSPAISGSALPAAQSAGDSDEISDASSGDG